MEVFKAWWLSIGLQSKNEDLRGSGLLRENGNLRSVVVERRSLKRGGRAAVFKAKMEVIEAATFKAKMEVI
ncbi:hypothetical protein NL676_038628 [Syzygium grande]|nr:hypothetical protein NL676_038628 [Syzygium grande]